jgi:hypothetical protein
MPKSSSGQKRTADKGLRAVKAAADRLIADGMPTERAIMQAKLDT